MKRAILDYLKNEILSGQAEDLESEDDLLGAEIVDSLGIMRLIAFIEERFAIQVPPEDVTVENFLSVDAICAYLSQRKS